MLLLLAALTCTGPEYHLLDFWLGEWDVANPAGQREGSNLISRAQDGCAVREQWTDADGSTGESLFYYDRAAGRWKQVWVTSGGEMKEKTAQPVEGGVQFTGAKDRTTLTQLPGGRVRQWIERPSDGAKWEGIYTRRPVSTGCTTRDFDFWVGDWDVTIRAQQTPGGAWGEARGRNTVQATYGGCVIEEHFHGEGPGTPWNGHSVSVHRGDTWRQTWVDDSGGYLAFTGGMQDGRMVLLGEPGKAMQKRMVFSDIKPDSLHWSWEHTTDGGKTWAPEMTIEYKRR